MAYTTAALSGALLVVDGRALDGGTIELPPGSKLLIDTTVEGSEPGDLLEEIAATRDEVVAVRDEIADLALIQFDTDGVPFITEVAGDTPTTPIQFDTDGIPYLIGA